MQNFGSHVGGTGFLVQKSKEEYSGLLGTGYSWGGTGFPVQIFQRKLIFFMGTGFLPGGTEFPIHFPGGVLFQNCGNRVLPWRSILGCWEPVTPGEELVSQFKFFKENYFFYGNRFPAWRNRV